MTHPLNEAIAQFLAAALDRGFEMPLYIAAISSNGSVYIGRYDPGPGDLNPVRLAEHTEGAGFILPINMMLTDTNGNVARMAVHFKEEPKFFFDEKLKGFFDLWPTKTPAHQT